MNKQESNSLPIIWHNHLTVKYELWRLRNQGNFEEFENEAKLALN